MLFEIYITGKSGKEEKMMEIRIRLSLLRQLNNSTLSYRT